LGEPFRISNNSNLAKSRCLLSRISHQFGKLSCMNKDRIKEFCCSTNNIGLMTRNLALVSRCATQVHPLILRFPGKPIFKMWH
jgi:hypothetical protein